MSEHGIAFSKGADAARIRKIWQEAVETIPPRQTVAKAPMFGINLRLNVLKALQATFETAKVSVETLAAAHTTFDPVTWLGISIEAWSAVQTIVASLVQKMRPIDYITYVILSQSPDGVTETVLKQSVEKFVRDPKLFDFTWHLRMTEAKARQASEVIEQPNWLETAVGKLAEENMVERRGDLLVFRSRNITLRGEE